MTKWPRPSAIRPPLPFWSPGGSYENEGRILQAAAELPDIDPHVTGLANTEIDLDDDEEDQGITVADKSDAPISPMPLHPVNLQNWWE